MRARRVRVDWRLERYRIHKVHRIARARRTPALPRGDGRTSFITIIITGSHLSRHFLIRNLGCLAPSLNLSGGVHELECSWSFGLNRHGQRASWSSMMQESKMNLCGQRSAMRIASVLWRGCANSQDERDKAENRLTRLQAMLPASESWTLTRAPSAREAKDEAVLGCP